MIPTFHFPFGSKLRKVEQNDRTPKEIFVLGVYASAVHAKWIGRDGKQKVAALAVASEPEIFWRGENAEEIISTISIPAELGRLVAPTNPNLNGPSGRALDELFLKPLGYARKQAWFCDLLPYSRVNEKQRNALNKYYTPEIINQYKLPLANIPDFNKNELNSPERRLEILKELELSGADKIVLLGDLPIQCFLSYYDKRYSKLSKFGESLTNYGKEHDIVINGKSYKVIPLCHPRQAGKLGAANTKWGELHVKWKEKNE